MKQNNFCNYVPQILAIAMIVWGMTGDHPYGYYTLLRVITSAIFAYLAVRAQELGIRNWVWILAVFAIIYNPILPLHLGRDLWTKVNLLTLPVLAVSTQVFRIRNRKDEAEESTK